jgi:hypothetical protein
MLSTRELLASLSTRDFECHEQLLRDRLADHLADVEDAYRSPSISHMRAPARRCNGQNGPVGSAGVWQVAQSRQGSGSPCAA